MKKTVMVIDDSQVIRKTANLFLKQDYNVVLVEDGFAALSEVIKTSPDIIFVDLIMPNMTGYDFCELMKNHEDFAHIPIIILSSKDSVFDIARAKMLGADDYLTKPFQKEELHASIIKFVKTD